MRKRSAEMLTQNNVTAADHVIYCIDWIGCFTIIFAFEFGKIEEKVDVNDHHHHRQNDSWRYGGWIVLYENVRHGVVIKWCWGGEGWQRSSLCMIIIMGDGIRNCCILWFPAVNQMVDERKEKREYDDWGEGRKIIHLLNMWIDRYSCVTNFFKRRWEFNVAWFTPHH